MKLFEPVMKVAHCLAEKKKEGARRTETQKPEGQTHFKNQQADTCFAHGFLSHAWPHPIGTSSLCCATVTGRIVIGHSQCDSQQASLQQQVLLHLCFLLLLLLL